MKHTIEHGYSVVKFMWDVFGFTRLLEAPHGELMRFDPFQAPFTAGHGRLDLRNTRPAEDDDEAHQEQCARLEKAAPDLQRHLITGELPLRLQLLRRVEYAKMIETLRDGETIMDRAQELREVLLCFHRAGLTPERLKLLYSHIAAWTERQSDRATAKQNPQDPQGSTGERDFPRFEAAGALLPMANAVSLCHTMLATGLSSPGAVVVLLRSASRTPLMEVADDAKDLRLLKAIELLIRVDFLYTQELRL
eukprot:g19453.t1